MFGRYLEARLFWTQEAQPDEYTFREPGLFRFNRARWEMRKAGEDDRAARLIFARATLSRRQYRRLEARRTEYGDDYFFDAMENVFEQGLVYLFEGGGESDEPDASPAVAPKPKVERPSGPDWSHTRWYIGRRDNWTCITGCGATGLSFQRGNGPTSAHVDHIIPLAKGGHPTKASNLQLLCGPCNLAKGARDIAPWVVAHG
jgi:hypothetical protein